MKITITGSLGHISEPLTKELVRRGHAVTVISSKTEKEKAIEALGASAAIGSLDDLQFLTTAFTGADAVYCMIPPNHFKEPDAIAYYRRLGNNYAKAIQQAGVKRVVHLSSFGADLDKGTGFILGSHNVENILNELSGVAITHMRPTSFYYNLYSFVNMIKGAGFIAANYGGDDKLLWVSPIDIASAVAEEIVTPSIGRKIQYVASDELTGNEIASIIGAAIGKPMLKWIIITNEQMHSGLVATGVPKHVADNLVEMFASFHSGALSEDYYRNKPAVIGKVKLTDFAEEFAATFNQK
jgi:uncharacterized protein YbjT (DUF2867 family)